ncbi:protoporphyrinogen oxidase HemJ [Stappia sp. F7233]|uniref:Protoporphyrinogen IX oxidase n=1 Tax=Stappia albiluteola TaxID=2758565 RepID=A0A839AGV6_9HYPH|nr:protoporphyrinogen oxidase HemJ [Stappia albiluteola]MBA5778911.1 protoporphyrinogen oxidase HemJ [Stappia albiluteola]
MDLYLWLKSFHVMAIIAWMAGLFYLPRLFVYHADSVPGSERSETFKIMERRLLKAIMNPAMIATWILGLAIAYLGGFLTSGWFHAKMLAVIVLSGFHGHLARCVRSFESDTNIRTAKYYRVINEVPTVLMIAIVILVIGKPF